MLRSLTMAGMGDRSPVFDVDLLQCGQMQDPLLSMRSTPDHLRDPLVIDEDQPSASRHDQSNECFDFALEVATRDAAPSYERPSCRFQLSWQPHPVASSSLTMCAPSPSADFTDTLTDESAIDGLGCASTRPLGLGSGFQHHLHPHHPHASYASHLQAQFPPQHGGHGGLRPHQYPINGWHQPARCSSTHSTASTCSSTMSAESSGVSCPDFAEFNLHSPLMHGAMHMFGAAGQPEYYTQLQPHHYWNTQCKQELCYDPRPSQAASSTSTELPVCPPDFKPKMTSTPREKSPLPHVQFSPEKESELCSFFKLCPYPTRESKKRLSVSLQLPYASVQGWFMRKRKAVYRQLLNRDLKNMSKEELEMTKILLKRKKSNLSSD